MTSAMTLEDTLAALDEVMADPAKVRREIEAKIREDRPGVTQAQLDAEWGLVDATLGL